MIFFMPNMSEEDRRALDTYLTEMAVWRDGESERMKLAAKGKHFASPVTEAMQADVAARCKPIQDEYERTLTPVSLDPPPWENRSGHKHTCYLDTAGKPRRCGYCNGSIRHDPPKKTLAPSLTVK